jgi:hypothetical protein
VGTVALVAVLWFLMSLVGAMVSSVVVMVVVAMLAFVSPE